MKDDSKPFLPMLTEDQYPPHIYLFASMIKSYQSQPSKDILIIAFAFR